MVTGFPGGSPAGARDDAQHRREQCSENLEITLLKILYYDFVMSLSYATACTAKASDTNPNICRQNSFGVQSKEECLILA